MSFGFDKIFLNYLPKYVKGYLHVNNNPVNVAYTAFCVNISISNEPGCVNTSLMLAYSKQIKKIIQ